MQVERKLPELEITRLGAAPLIRGLIGKKPVILASRSNHELAENLSGGRALLVPSIRIEQAMELIGRIRRMDARVIIGMGGGKVLDVARFCAANVEGTELIVIPPILASAALSVDKSAMIDADGERRYLQTLAPAKVVVSLPFVMDQPPGGLVKWCSSGFGDCFARISAAMDVAYYRHGNASAKAIEGIEPETMRLLEWAVSEFKGYGEESITKLAEALHNNGIGNITRGGPSPPSSEHVFSNLMEDSTGKLADKPTHGQAVSVGILITAYVFEKISGGAGIYPMLRNAFEKMGLPTTYGKLGEIGITGENIAKVLEKSGKCEPDVLLKEFWKVATGAIDRIYSES